ncbi:MAG: DUF4258 domain-containing protein [Microcoleus sp. PH2017_10_PVI_O_A]|uniref:DUF4258 domain-containing protein n=1 Tax=unclassified Microcoleus TaxID=2642155 RepID=UPI001D9B1B88|nr:MULTISPECIES: DUF4258 domain-containing protein [unclassified Microcoleus]TAE81794.1 MAG: DUF4258 domain-containing protein [Oscillatoriales cyanobacterium]MCC3406928.1 DUF4258 domain-containing protein [Microcoleus sp. PH2017_10_PVI_O_A]MCC3461024.1 DUF4258 domain-containing protein [Microcoleus sp. PH2017_11_PCY_U_A]MCC3479573.1 DUF4258 domain-containing protein [Microcoleus sp. PH2017_12_PCY_D_A]MCC3526772.1 DUF4258 domain-containing protein [Microcoleus sp. PH2017_21_RUC_O_A]
MKTIEEIRQQLQSGELEVSVHALRRMVERNISEIEIRQVGENAIIIEDYPDDKYSPSCLVLGFTTEGKVLHVQVSRKESDSLKIITLYEPDANQWINYSQRR